MKAGSRGNILVHESKSKIDTSRYVQNMRVRDVKVVIESKALQKFFGSARIGQYHRLSRIFVLPNLFGIHRVVACLANVEIHHCSRDLSWILVFLNSMVVDNASSHQA